MASNVDTVQSTTTELDRHRRLADELADELASWSPRERLGAFKAWHRGDLSLVHLNVVAVIEVEGPLSMGRLAEALDVSVASVTGIVSRMEKRGLVERRHGEGDRRVVLVHPTEAGAHIFREVEQRRHEGLARLLDKLSDEQLDGFLAGLRVLRAAHAEMVPGAASDRAADSSGPGGSSR